jgi:hypothetical protein
MMMFIKKMFGANKAPERDFSSFFNNASEKDKMDLLGRVVREANNDQKKLMQDAGRLSGAKED